MCVPGGRAVLRAMLVTVAVGIAAAGTASAATTFTVNTTADPSGAGDCAGSGTCSLRQAVATADADTSMGDTVELPASVTPYAVTQGMPITVNNGITISGAAANTTTIDGSGNSDAGVFTVDGDATFSGVTISGGNAGTTGKGGAIDVENGSATLDDDALSNDTAADGGAVEVGSSDANVIIDDSTLGPGDTAVVDEGDDGKGGAIDNDGGYLSVSNSTISGDSATGGGVGGGISTEAGGETDLSYDTIASNSATGSDAEGGDLFAGNDGDPAVDVAATIVADGAAPEFPDCNYNSGTDNFDSGVTTSPTTLLPQVSTRVVSRPAPTTCSATRCLGRWRTTVARPRPRRRPPAARRSTRFQSIKRAVPARISEASRGRRGPPATSAQWRCHRRARRRQILR